MFTRANSLNDIVSEAVKHVPDKVALSDTNRTLTYEQLHTRSAAVAQQLAEKGVNKGDLIGLLVDRSVDVVIGILAILRCGAAYVPIDPTYPVDRQKFIIEDSGISFVLGSSSALDSTEFPSAVLVFDLDTPDCIGVPVCVPAEVGSADAAYVIYTSGSTGVPKGCVVTHGNVLSLLSNALPLFAVDADDCWSIFHSFSFDFSVWELWGALATGAKAVIVPHEATQLPSSLVRVLTQEKVTVLSQVPSVFRNFSSLQRYPTAHLRYIIFGGESVDLAAIGKFWSRCDDARPIVINMYGITETTVHSTFRQITEADLTSAISSPIGVALPHLTIELRDDEPPHRQVEEGEIGEMWVSGTGVADGYLNRVELTARRFVVDDFSGVSRRYYRSGDLARRLPNGELEYLGRNDHQVKLRGFRIELGEIESTIRSQAGVLDAALCVVALQKGSKLLVACIVPTPQSEEQDSTVEAIRSMLGKKLPNYMHPDRYLLLSALPLTLSGKLDRNQLKKLAAEDMTKGAAMHRLGVK